MVAIVDTVVAAADADDTVYKFGIIGLYWFNTFYLYTFIMYMVVIHL